MKRKRSFHVTWTHAISLGRTLFEKDAAIQIARWQHSASYWLPAENGPATTLPIALSLYKSCGRIDFVILDINLRGTAVFPMARCLSQDGVPFLFCTGYDDQPVRSEFAGVPHLKKISLPAGLCRDDRPDRSGAAGSFWIVLSHVFAGTALAYVSSYQTKGPYRLILNLQSRG